jgi:hypothetical protein
MMTLMNTTQITRREVETLIVTDGPTTLEYSPETDARVLYIEDGKVLTYTEQDAEEIAAEARCWGVSARALGHAVVFWS